MSIYTPGGSDPKLREAARDLAQADFGDTEARAGGDHAARAAGQICGRCGRSIEADQDVRRRASGDWVHEECPVTG